MRVQLTMPDCSIQCAIGFRIWDLYKRELDFTDGFGYLRSEAVQTIQGEYAERPQEGT